MNWIQIKFDVNAEHADQVADALQTLAADAVTFEDAEDNPVFEPDPGEIRLWHRTRVVGLFAADIDTTSMVETVRQQLGSSIIYAHSIEVVPDKDWVRASLEHFKPLRCGQRLWICPTWHTPPDPTAVNVMLNPGLAFGTGAHPTTALCLEWLDAHPPHEQRVLDFGCGSGILAVAATMLNASQVDVVDHDPQAIEATLANAQINDMTARVRVVTADQLIPHTYHTILANILAAPLIQLAPSFASWIQPHGALILSGILSEQKESIVAAYQTWFTITNIVERQNWLCIAAKRT